MEQTIQIIEKLFFHIGIYIDLLPFLIFIFFFKKCKEEKSIALLVISTTLAFILNVITNVIDKDSLIYLFVAFTFLEFTFFLIFFYLHLKGSFTRKIIVISFIGFIISLIIDFRRPDFQFNSISVGVETIITMILSIFFLYSRLKELKSVTADYRFWVIMGFLLYLAGSFFIYIYASQVGIKELKRINLWFLTWVFYIFKSVFISIAILIYVRQPKEKNTTHPESIPFLDMI